ncbi:hypothetical protein GCK72_006260 [Caenorhabditis remanei]|uniref:Uncharacterized protein n=1 Tax=Caenorhabditis remanei TaxID=31234 RepID=A0A6A5HI36_CAERE|nr:hypothetical protein GCK72_006260 [Caenorhabditis remanei]KAF1766304.1 hypothetical protein GCK72_006260 [Caenorhabditis remanei]
MLIPTQISVLPQFHHLLLDSSHQQFLQFPNFHPNVPYFLSSKVIYSDVLDPNLDLVPMVLGEAPDGSADITNTGFDCASAIDFFFLRCFLRPDVLLDGRNVSSVELFFRNAVIIVLPLLTTPNRG